MPSCFLEILSSGPGYVAAKTRGAELCSVTILDQDSGAGVRQTAAAIAVEPESIESDTDHEALKETNAMASWILIDSSAMLLVGRQTGDYAVVGEKSPFSLTIRGATVATSYLRSS